MTNDLCVDFYKQFNITSYPKQCLVYFVDCEERKYIFYETNGKKREKVEVVEEIPDKDNLYAIKLNFGRKIQPIIYLFEDKDPIYIPADQLKKIFEMCEVATNKNLYVSIKTKVKINVLTGCAGQGKTTEFFNIVKKLGEINYSSYTENKSKLSFLIYINDRYDYQELYYYLRKLFDTESIGAHIDYTNLVNKNSLVPLWVPMKDNFEDNDTFTLIPIFWTRTNILYLAKYKLPSFEDKHEYNIFYDEIRLSEDMVSSRKRERIIERNKVGFNEMIELLSNSQKAEGERIREMSAARVKYTFPEEVLKALLKVGNRIFLAGTFLLHTSIMNVILNDDNDIMFNLFLLNGTLSTHREKYRSGTLPLIVSILEKKFTNKPISDNIKEALKRRKGEKPNPIPGELLFQWLSCERYVSTVSEKILQATTYRGEATENPAIGSYFLPTIGPLPYKDDIAEGNILTEGKFCIVREKKIYTLFKYTENQFKAIHYSETKNDFFNIFTIMATTHKDMVTNYYLAYLHKMSIEEYHNLPFDYGKIGYGRAGTFPEANTIAAMLLSAMRYIESNHNVNFFEFVYYLCRYSNRIINIVRLDLEETSKDVEISDNEKKDLEEEKKQKENKITYLKKEFSSTFDFDKFKVKIVPTGYITDDELMKKKFPFCIPGEYEFGESTYSVENEIKQKDLICVIRGPCKRGNPNSSFDFYGKGKANNEVFNLWGEVRNRKNDNVSQHVKNLLKKTCNELNECFKDAGGNSIDNFDNEHPTVVLACLYHPKGIPDNTNVYTSFKAECTMTFTETEETKTIPVDFIITQIFGGKDSRILRELKKRKLSNIL